MDAKSLTAPLTVKMDPRITIPASGLQKKFQAEMQLASALTDTTQALAEGDSIRAQLDNLQKNSSEIQNAVLEFQKKVNALRGAGGGPFAPPTAEVTLGSVNGEAATLYGQIWQVDAEPTTAQMAALASVDHDSADVLKRWAELKNSDLPGLNRC